MELLADGVPEEPTRVMNEPTRRALVDRETDLVRTAAQRHPATIAVIQEITAQVEARVEKRIELAKAEPELGIALVVELAEDLAFKV